MLYEIDPRPYQAAYDAAKAQVAQNEASLELAKQNNTRFKALAKENPGAVTASNSTSTSPRKIRPSRTWITPRPTWRPPSSTWTGPRSPRPSPGWIGRLLVTRGNLITANQTTLTTIVSQDPMWVYFDADEPTVLQVHDLIRQGKFGPVREGGKPPLFLGSWPTEKGFPHEANLDFVNNQLDPATATLHPRCLPEPQTGPRPTALRPEHVRARPRADGEPYQACW